MLPPQCAEKSREKSAQLDLLVISFLFGLLDLLCNKLLLAKAGGTDWKLETYPGYGSFKSATGATFPIVEIAQLTAVFTERVNTCLPGIGSATLSPPRV